MGDSERETRREIVKKALYVAPAILTLTASPAFAQRGSGGPARDDDKRGKDKHKHKRDK
jgi:hypothetical protein